MGKRTYVSILGKPEYCICSACFGRDFVEIQKLWVKLWLKVWYGLKAGEGFSFPMGRS